MALAIEIPGTGELRLEHLVLDYNGTLAIDGCLIAGVADRLRSLARTLQVHVVTADTFGRAQAELGDVPCNLSVLPPGDQDARKLAYIRALDVGRVVAIGNGRNDRAMIEAAALGIAVVQAEGAAVETMLAADVVVSSVLDALDLLATPLRLKATLRR
jgi:soluble P-type ATPase